MTTDRGSEEREMSAREDLIEHFASVMYEHDDVMADWHHAKPEDREEYLRIATAKVDACCEEVLREAGVVTDSKNSLKP